MSTIPYVINKWPATDYAFCLNNNLLTDIIEEDGKTILVFNDKQSYNVYLDSLNDKLSKFITLEIRSCSECPFLKYTQDNGDDEIESYCSKTNKTIHNESKIDEECPL